MCDPICQTGPTDALWLDAPQAIVYAQQSLARRLRPTYTAADGACTMTYLPLVAPARPPGVAPRHLSSTGPFNVKHISRLQFSDTCSRWTPANPALIG